MLVGLLAVLQPYCLGEGTDFVKYLFAGVNNRTLAPTTLIGIGFAKLFATRVALSFGFIGGKFFPTMFLGGCVGCAVFLWANPDDHISIIHRAEMPLLFPFTCLMANSVAGLGALFFSIPMCVVFVFGLDGPQSSCVLLSCLVAYVLLHGVGKGLLPMVFERQMLAQLRLLDGNTAVLRRSVSDAAVLRASVSAPTIAPLSIAEPGALSVPRPVRATSLQEGLLTERRDPLLPTAIVTPLRSHADGGGARAEAWLSVD